MKSTLSYKYFFAESPTTLFYLFFIERTINIKQVVELDSKLM